MQTSGYLHLWAIPNYLPYIWAITYSLITYSQSISLLSHTVWECARFGLSSAMKGIYKATHLMLNDYAIFRSFVVQIVPHYYLIDSPNTTVKREFDSFSNFYHVKYSNIEISHKLWLMYFYSVLFLICSAAVRNIHHSMCSIWNN